MSENIVNDRCSAGVAGAVVNLSMADTWEPVIDEPCEFVADDEDPFSTTHRSSEPNYIGQQVFPPENLAWDGLAAHLAAHTHFLARQSQSLQQTSDKLQRLLEKMRKPV